MKNILLFLFFAFSLHTMAQTGNDGWEDWQKTSCYSKISFRIKYTEQRGEQHVWKVQFRNDYPQLVSFNYHITDKVGEYNATTHRKTVNQKQVSEEVEVFTAEQDIYLIVDKVSLSPYAGNFVDCDQ